jgi:predicted ABC-type transport system involved in lysophospholipase L1 biosynthesis ATPase subunit
VALAVALANGPDLLLADEIVGELDSRTAAQVVRVVFEASRHQGLAVLLVTHSRELAARADRQLALLDGRIRQL